MIALPLIVLAITGSPLSMGIAAALERLPILLQPLAGVLADKLNRKRILLFCDSGRFIISGVMGILYLLGNLYFWEICLAALVMGILTQLYNTSQFASVPKLVRKKDLQLVNSINTGIFQTAVFIAPGLGGILISIYNPGIGLLINSLSFAMGFLVVFSLNLSHEKREKGSGWLAEVKEGFVFVIKEKPILYTNLAMLFSVFGTTLFITMLVVHLKLTAGFSSAEIGYLLSIGGAAAIAGALLTNFIKQAFTYRMILFTGGTIGGASIIGFGLADSFVLLAVMNAIGTISAAIMSTCIVTIRQILSPEQLVGRVGATSRFMTWLLMPLAALTAGVIAETFGTGHAIVIGGLIAVLSSFIYLAPSLKAIN
ncbi:MFS transporter [Rossellomorea vietnamensis]|uniref:MFS transporter n=1 Tax=Rossellomorea vietnamensis TaxID=218284 RepID=UPI00207862B9|nr:MFS transporter [Rossellomorea vietnamensis]